MPRTSWQIVARWSGAGSRPKRTTGHAIDYWAIRVGAGRADARIGGRIKMHHAPFVGHGAGSDGVVVAHGFGFRARNSNNVLFQKPLPIKTEKSQSYQQINPVVCLVQQTNVFELLSKRIGATIFKQQFELEFD
jgi:hypothetical protein